MSGKCESMHAAWLSITIEYLWLHQRNFDLEIFV